jgi:hypothetical protein
VPLAAVSSHTDSVTTRSGAALPRPAVTSTSLEADEYVRRLESMVLRLLRGRFSSADDLWRLQLDLLALQRDIQRAIKACKAERRSDQASHERLVGLRHARWHARRFGDAYAWVVLGFDRRTIFPLAKNTRVAIADENHGSRGLLAISEGLSNEGWGFPLLHDITDTLRVGDVTFVKPGEARSRQVSTFEVKTRLMAERLADDGKTQFEYQVTVASPSPFDPARGGAPVDVSSPPPTSAGGGVAQARRTAGRSPPDPSTQTHVDGATASTRS